MSTDPAARCAALGDAALVGDLEACKKATWLVNKNAPPCVLFHAAMANVRLAKKGGAGSLRRAIQLLAKIGDDADAPVREWARVRQMELALRLKQPELAPEVNALPAELPNADRRWQLTTALVSYTDPNKGT